MFSNSTVRRLFAPATLALVLAYPVTAQNSSYNTGVVVDGKEFALNGNGVSYRFYADETGDLISTHFGGPVTESIITPPLPDPNGWVGLPGRVRREYPDLGRGDFRIPAFQIRQSEGYTVSDFQYKSHDVIQGKPALPGLPATFGSEGEVTTLVVHLYDNYSSVAADLSYSIFPEHDAIVRSVNITNEGPDDITLEKISSLSVDLPYEDLDMIELRGDWAREAQRVRRKVEYGTQGFGSLTGYSSHLHNPFLALLSPTTTESHGEAWGFSLVYSGSFSVDVEKGSQGFTRAILGLNPYQFSWSLGPGETFTSPEAVSVYSDSGVGGVSRKFHRLYRDNLIKSHYAKEDRPVLLNSWEGAYFDFNESVIYDLADASADLGIKLFVMDDGWFGDKYPRLSDNSSLGDWVVNKDRFPEGLGPLVDRITQLDAGNSSEKIRFGIWFEPEMVSPHSELYDAHPDWALHADGYPRTERRNQLVLNVGLPEVQDYIIDSVSKILESADISYVKWDNNRGMHETASPNTSHSYILGLYHVFEVLTTRFPDVLFEGCASGGGRFDPGMLQYFPQIWTSDDTDGLERIAIQFGTSLVYPPSTMGAHVSNVPNHQTSRTTPFTFRAHVAMMGGSFGFELDPADLDEDDKVLIPDLIALAEQLNPIVIQGDLWRLNLPEESNWPAALFITPDGESAVLFWFQVRANINHAAPFLRLQGLDPAARYTVEGNATYSGLTLMNIGLQYYFDGDYDSKVVLIEKAS
ncbi:putative alpha-galactosidase c protein [Eutypa lata UCREL1]|uniref:Alpha-galactosidase n=1 Tax=Eutypa lata (strain UCR-EL1) TaxID=1287681 RepID=M7SY26_EUTLA|nr:putative alpha-galactosidase c protein [Eutypa lata UCREL1]